MAQRRLEDLARLYNLAARIHALDPVKAAFRAYIKSTGLALIMDEEKVRAHLRMQTVVTLLPCVNQKCFSSCHLEESPGSPPPPPPPGSKKNP